MDGKLLYVDFKEGWDADEKVGPPNTPKPPPGPPKPAAWKWDGHNGNNGLWFGSTKAGVRLELKGEDPLWWAGSPYDSGTSPEPPLSCKIVILSQIACCLAGCLADSKKHHYFRGQQRQRGDQRHPERHSVGLLRPAIDGSGRQHLLRLLADGDAGPAARPAREV